ncbi:hypothetical protein OIO90_002871 [Microbotryomycetes sp. JL221]|nr:hypothetical protein OIO90_002871 [Microbotryomycetes sp. JL221]
MNDASRELGDALLAWVSSLNASHGASEALNTASSAHGAALTSLRELQDGVALGDILLRIDANYFHQLSSVSAKALTTSWILRFNHLKRLYKLVMRYFEEVLKSSTTNLPAPNLQLVAKAEASEEYDEEVCKLVGLVLALAVQSDQRLQFVNGIQSLDEWVQRDIMWSIEQVMSRVAPKNTSDTSDLPTVEGEPDADSEFYALHQDRSQVLLDRDALQFEHDELVRSFNVLKDDHDAALSNMAKMEKQMQESSSRKDAGSERADAIQKAEVERLKATLSVTEDQLSEVEQTAGQQQRLIDELTRKVEELAPRAEEASRLQDQLDEHKHFAERLKKAENVVDKYKKKLEEAGDLRRQIKTLEDENTELLDRYALLEEQHTKLASDMPQLDAYKSRIEKLESKLVGATRESEKLRHDLAQASAREKEVVSAHERVQESLIAAEERVQEFQLSESRKRAGDHDAEDNDASLNGISTTDLKLKVRKLQREIDKLRRGDAQGSDAGVAGVHAGLEEAERIRQKYEDEWMIEHRSRLKLETRLNDIAAGRSQYKDGPQSATALRHQIEKLSAQAETLERKNAELELLLEETTEELNVARSDLELVDKDQVEALHVLRQSMSEDKHRLQDKLADLRRELQSKHDELRMQASQVKALLEEQVALQKDGLEQRDRLLERQSDATEVEELKEKLQKAKAFIKQQDQLFREQYESDADGHFEASVQEYESRIATLEGELARQQTNTAELEARYRREQQLMLSAWHDLGMRNMRESISHNASLIRSNVQRDMRPPTSWLGQQRARTIDRSLRHT